jgi:hypothetical protein
MSGQFHAPAALTLGKALPVPTGWVVKRKKFLSVTEIEFRVVQFSVYSLQSLD